MKGGNTINRGSRAAFSFDWAVSAWNCQVGDHYGSILTVEFTW